MIRTNLSTRPFYSSRGVGIWLAVLAAIVAAATVFNVSRVLSYSGANTELASQAAQDEASATDMRATAARLRASVDPRQIAAAASDARDANNLIDRRTLSWTELFNRFETALPADVRITAVRPETDREQDLVLVVSVRARGVEDVEQFMQQLDASGAFRDVQSTRERTTEEGQIESVLEMYYSPSRRAAAPAPPQPQTVTTPAAVR